MVASSEPSSAHAGVTLRPACPVDLPDLARLHLLAHAEDPLLRHLTPRRDQYPLHAYVSALLMFRNTFYAHPTARYIVAESEAKEIVGYIAWAVKGSCELADQWKEEHKQITRMPRLEGRLSGLERSYWLNCVDRATSIAARGEYEAAMADNYKGLEQHVYCFAFAVHPGWRGRGIGKRLLNWGQDLGRRHTLPVVLQSSPMAYSLYLKQGFQTYMVAHAAVMDVPVLLWEPEQIKGKWLEEAEHGKVRLRISSVDT